MGRKRKDGIGYIIQDAPLTEALERPEVQEALMRALMPEMLSHMRAGGARSAAATPDGQEAPISSFAVGPNGREHGATDPRRG